MKVTVDGQVYDYDDDKLMFSEAADILQRTGMSMRQWQQGLNELNPFAVKALVFLLKKRAGENPDWDTLDFDLGSLDFEDAAEADPTPAETS